MTTEPDINEVLERYSCPHPLAVVRMRFWGAINSPAARVSPIEEIDALWTAKTGCLLALDEIGRVIFQLFAMLTNDYYRKGEE